MVLPEVVLDHAAVVTSCTGRATPAHEVGEGPRLMGHAKFP